MRDAFDALFAPASLALVGAFALTVRGQYGFAAGLAFGFCLLAGAVGYALRLRGFTETINAGT